MNRNDEKKLLKKLILPPVVILAIGILFVLVFKEGSLNILWRGVTLSAFGLVFIMYAVFTIMIGKVYGSSAKINSIATHIAIPTKTINKKLMPIRFYLAVTIFFAFGAFMFSGGIHWFNELAKS
jgi:hypothetical protein